jgi:hypothetical protein
MVAFADRVADGRVRVDNRDATSKGTWKWLMAA